MASGEFTYYVPEFVKQGTFLKTDDEQFLFRCDVGMNTKKEKYVLSGERDFAPGYVVFWRFRPKALGV